MQLWTDYEGVTIDGAVPLHKLLLPEGRSAFFSTAGPNGEPTVVRLIECHFDEEEILARWRCVEALNHPNFLRFVRYGQVSLDDGPVVYAVFERVDANLAEVLDQGRLSVKDVTQLAFSLTAALDVLHTHGFIHEHLEPRNIFAVGDVVKLRSDCIREAPENGEGRAAKQRDVRDLVTVLLQALTQRHSVEALSDSAVPASFRELIRNGLDGTWGLEQIRSSLQEHFGAGPDLERAAKPEPKQDPGKQPADQRRADQGRPAVTRVVADEELAAKPDLRGASTAATEPSGQLSLPLDEEGEESEFAAAETRQGSWRERPWREKESLSAVSSRSRAIAAAAIAVVLVVLVIWGFVHAWNGHSQAASSSPKPDAHPAVQAPAASSPVPAAKPTPRVSTHAAASTHGGWRVIAFTYKRRADAEKKAASLALSHPDLRPTVFTPSGHAPYLVSVGGVMERDAAYALARRSRSLGLPSDSYAQNYNR